VDIFRQHEPDESADRNFPNDHGNSRGQQPKPRYGDEVGVQ
jgi:hypothetical protein